jgi:hypothetical protein
MIDDARRFIRTSNKKYDLVLLDLVSGEVQPAHVFTQEGLRELRDILADDALVIVNFQGKFDMDQPELSLGPRSVLKTFASLGYDMFVSQRSDGEEQGRSSDLLIYGTPGGLDFKTALQQKLPYDDLFPFEEFTGGNFTPVPSISLQDALVLTDDKPNLELLNAPTILQWRTNKLEFVTVMLDKGLTIYQ